MRKSRHAVSVMTALMLSIAAGSVRAAIEAEIVLCIDVSPSISDAELEIERQGLLNCLGNTDIIPHDGTVAVGIVTYAEVAFHILDLTPVTPANLANVIHPALNNMARGMVAQTNISEGLLFAQAMLVGARSQTANDFILLAGDGGHNTGPPLPSTVCPQVRAAGTTICSIAIDANQSGLADLEMCAAPPDGQFGIAVTFLDFAPVCQACLSFFLGGDCATPVVCTDPGTCAAEVPCADIADCPSMPGATVIQSCDPTGPFVQGVHDVEVVCRANNQHVETLSCQVLVQDCEPPSILCPPDRDVACDAGTSPADTGTPSASDNCGKIRSLAHEDQLSDGECDGEFELIRTWTATDGSNNASSCIQMIRGVDQLPPNLFCPEVVNLHCDSPHGASSELVTFDVEAVDDCSSIVFISDDRPAGYFPPTCGSSGKPTFVTIKAGDSCGNESTCIISVFVDGDVCCTTPLHVDTEITLMPMTLDLRRELGGPTRTAAAFEVWNSNEIRFTGMSRCLTGWDRTKFSDFAYPNHFLMSELQTDKGKARINGLSTTGPCQGSGGALTAPPLLGLSVKELSFDAGSAVTMRAASIMRGIGAREAVIRHGDVAIPDPPDMGTRPGQSPTEPHDGPQLPYYADQLTPEDARPLVNALPVTPEPRQPTESATLPVGGTSQCGSVLYWVSVELKWNALGELIQDTFLSLSNDFGQEVHVKVFMVNGDPPTAPVIINGQTVERAHPGWNTADATVLLTRDESTYWSLATGHPKGTAPFTILDAGTPVGRPDPDPQNPGGRILRGFVAAWAADASGRELSWNHLTGSAHVVNYSDATAFAYPAWAFRCVREPSEGLPCARVRGEIRLDGLDYEAAPGQLLLDFFPIGSPAFFSIGGEP